MLTKCSMIQYVIQFMQLCFVMVYLIGVKWVQGWLVVHKTKINSILQLKSPSINPLKQSSAPSTQEIRSKEELQVRYLDGEREIKVVDIPRQHTRKNAENIRCKRPQRLISVTNLPRRNLYLKESATPVAPSQWSSTLMDDYPRPYLEFGMGYSGHDLSPN